MNLSPKNKLLLTAVGVAVVVIALAAVLVLPQLGRLTQLEADISAAEQASQSANTLLEQRRAVRNRAAATDAQLMQLATSFPENPELTSAIIELQDLAYENDIELRAVTPAALEPRGSHVAVPIELQVWGDWEDCVMYTQQLATLNRQYRVVEINTRILSEDENILSEVDLDWYATGISVKLEAYVIPASDGATTTAPAAPAPTQ